MDHKTPGWKFEKCQLSLGGSITVARDWTETQLQCMAVKQALSEQ